MASSAGRRRKAGFKGGLRKWFGGMDAMDRMHNKDGPHGRETALCQGRSAYWCGSAHDPA